MFNFFQLKGRKRATRPVALMTIFGSVLTLVLACSGASDSMQSSSPPSPTSTAASTVVSQAPTGVSDGVVLGTNLYGISDWSTQMPFLDAFKTARKWMTQCEQGESGCTGSWETQEYDKLDLDEQGWVKSLPAPDDPPEYTRASTLLYREMNQYPGGQYLVLYDGEGKLNYKFDAQKDEAASKPGRDVINVKPSQGGILLQIVETDPNKTGNYIRNIRVVRAQDEGTYQSQIFNPLFLEKTRKFKALRFMDWMDTNNSEQSEWSNRPKVEDASYAWKGAPVEIMVELANRLQADPWFNMPHMATDEYMTNFARLVQERLNPNLKAYVELSNEVWNWQFKQSHYAADQGKARWGDKGDVFMQWYGMRAAQMSDIWKGVFQDQPDRVVPVIATQTAWQGLENSALDCSEWVAEGHKPCYQHGFKVYAVTGYFSGALGSKEHASEVETWLSDRNSAFTKAIAKLKDSGDWGDSVRNTADGFRYHADVAQKRGLKMVAYEGGQHIVGSGGNENNEKLTEFLIELNRRPEMYQVYTDLLNNWKAAGGTLFMHFSDIGQPSKWGSWGALENVTQDHSPKYDALMDFIDRNVAK
jgi:hypothetical protein